MKPTFTPRSLSSILTRTIFLAFLLVVCTEIADATCISDGYNTNCVFKAHTWSSDANICDGATMKTGDFNGDHKKDIICIYDIVDANDFEIRLSRPTSTYDGIDFTVDYTWCNFPTDAILIGDFDGDHRSDILCHNAAGTNQVVFNEVGHYFSEPFISDAIQFDTDPLCPDVSNSLHVGDFDGDGIDDLLCHDSTDGHVSITYGRHHVGRLKRHIYPFIIDSTYTHPPDGAAVAMPLHICNQANDKILIGDVDANGKEDMVCYNYATAEYTVARMDHYGAFVADQTITITTACDDINDVYLLQGDNNHRKDLYCQVGAVPKVILHASGTLADVCEVDTPEVGSVCANDLIFADVNGDGRDDHLCFTSAAPSQLDVIYNECV